MNTLKLLKISAASLFLAAGTCVPLKAEETLPSGMGYDVLFYELDDYIDDREDDIASVAAAVFTKDEVLFSGIYGYTDREQEIEADEMTVYDWGPVSQLLVWTAGMQLKEEGLLDLDADIRGYLPDGFLSNLRYDTPVTMKHLMSHTAGFEELFLDTRQGSVSKIPPLGEALQRHLPDQVYEPGTVTSQSDWGAALAGYIIERVSGMDYADYVHEHILDPLGMTQTAVRPGLTDVEGMMGRRLGQKCYTVRMQNILEDFYLYSLYPCGSAVGTFADFRTFTAGLIPGSEESKVLFHDAATLDEMMAGTTFYSSGKVKNSHGLWHTMRGVELTGITGSTTGSTASFQYDPASGTAVCIMTNVAQETLMTDGITELVFGAGDDTYKDKKNLPKGRFMTANSILTGPFRFASYRAAKLGEKDITDGYWELSEDGKILEQPYTDYLKVSAGTWLRNDLLVFWFWAAFVAAAGALIFWIWPLPGRSGAAKELRMLDRCTKAAHISVLLITVIMMFSFQLGAGFFDTSYFSAAYPAIGILAAFLAVCVAAYLFFLAKLWKDDPSPRVRIMRLARALLWTGVIVNVVYWQLYAGSLL